MQNYDFLAHLFDSKLLGVLRLFLQFPEKKFYLKEISDSSEVSIATTHRILTRLVKLDVLSEIKISKFKVYELAKNDKVDFLSSFIDLSVDAVEIFVEKVKNLPGIEKIILHGKATKNKANLFLIGSSFPSSEIKLVVAELREKYNFTITYLTFGQEQYEQMSVMGLFPQTKKILFPKS
jgi:hypothetical protein